MSGPWDRPSSPDPGDEWPSEDLRTADDPWRSSDPWREPTPSASSGWDDWSPPAPLPDDPSSAEPEPPASDLWSESWADDVPPGPPEWSPEPEAALPAGPSEWSPEPEATLPPSEPPPPRAEPWSFDADPWAPVVEPAPVADTPADRAEEAWYRLEPEPATEREPQLEAEATWRPEPEFRTTTEDLSWPPAAEAVATPYEPSPTPSAEEAPRLGAERVATPEATDALQAPPPAPMPEPPAAAAEPEAEPPVAVGPEAAGELEAASEPLPEQVVPRKRSWWSSGPASWLGEPEPEEEPAVTAEPVPTEERPVTSAQAPTPTKATEVESEPEVVAQPEPEVVGEPEVEPEVVSEPDLEPEVPSEPEPEPDIEPEPQVVRTPAIASLAEAEPEPEAPAEPEAIAPVWSPEPWAPIAVPSEPTDGPEAEPEVEWGGEREMPAAAATLAPEPTSEPMPTEPRWPDELEGTQVFPSTWAPPAPTAAGELEPSAGPVSTTFASRATAEELEEEPAPTTAEQAVPWLIGAILLLAGMVIVLLALIFAGDASLGGGGTGPSGSAEAVAPSGSGEATEEPTPTPRASTSAAPSVSVAPTPTPLAIPEYGPLEMVYLGRSAPLAHIFLLRHDFTVQADPEVLAQDPDLDVRRFAWSPDGLVGVGLYADLLISVEPGEAKRRMADGISTVTFGTDPATLYAVRVTQDGANDVATVLSFDFASGDSSELASVSYARPTIGAESALPEAQFVDEGGPVRLFWLENGSLRLWSLGGGVWEIDPVDGTVTPSSGDLPALWSPRGNRRVAATQASGTSTLELRDDDDAVLATTTVEGLVSHLRWSPDGDRVVFTLGRTGTGGGVLQDLFLWDLGDGEAPMQLTSTGAAFSAEWLGSFPVWRE